MNGYILGGTALVIAVLWGLYKYEARKAEEAEQRRIVATAMVDVANQQVAAAKAVNQENAAALEGYKAALEAQVEVAKKFEGVARQRDADLKQALKRIQNAPNSDDGPVAPVLKRELDGLRLVAPRSDTADSAGENGTGSNPDPSEPGLPVTAGSPGS